MNKGKGNTSTELPPSSSAYSMDVLFDTYRKIEIQYITQWAQISKKRENLKFEMTKFALRSKTVYFWNFGVINGFFM